MHKLDPLYKSYHIKNSSGVIWGHRGQKVIFTKNVSTQTDYVALTHDSCICISLTPSTKVITLKIHPGSFGVTGVKRSFSPKCFNSNRLRSIDTWLMHMHKLDSLYKSYHIKNSSGVIWGHRGQKVIFTKNVSTQTDYVALTHDLCICISLTPSTKVITLKIHLGSFGVTGVKRSFSPKMLQLKQIT